MKLTLVILSLVLAFYAQPDSDSLSDPNQNLSRDELINRFNNGPTDQPNRRIRPNQPQVEPASSINNAGETLADPNSNESPQQLLAKFTDNTARADVPAAISSREVMRTVSMEQQPQSASLRSGSVDQQPQFLSSRISWNKCFFKYGLTWRKKSHTCANGLEFVGCQNCNPYQGDTQCYQRRPILCIFRAQDVRPDYTVSIPFYEGWSGGHIKISAPIRGCYIYSKAHADSICRSQFGWGWGIASHHDGHYIWGMNGSQNAYQSWYWGFASEGGWNFYAYGNVSTTPYNNYWVYIRNQPGNCWN